MPSPDTSSATSSSLLKRVQELDPEAWQRLARIYGPLVYRWARKAGLQDADASDVGQEVFQTVAVRIGSFQHGRPGDTFRGWLRIITRNKLGDYFRRRVDEPAAQGGSTASRQLGSVPDLLCDDLPDADEWDTGTGLVHRALRIVRTDFEEKTWQAFWRAAVEGQRADNIAEDLGMTAKAVRQAKYRVLRRLRIDLNQLID
jgi:RNA polymerase sigma-70 factor (ECF subfamily)